MVSPRTGVASRRPIKVRKRKGPCPSEGGPDTTTHPQAAEDIYLAPVIPCRGKRRRELRSTNGASLSSQSASRAFNPSRAMQLAQSTWQYHTCGSDGNTTAFANLGPSFGPGMAYCGAPRVIEGGHKRDNRATTAEAFFFSKNTAVALPHIKIPASWGLDAVPGDSSYVMADAVVPLAPSPGQQFRCRHIRSRARKGSYGPFGAKQIRHVRQELYAPRWPRKKLDDPSLLSSECSTGSSYITGGTARLQRRKGKSRTRHQRKNREKSPIDAAPRSSASPETCSCSLFELEGKPSGGDEAREVQGDSTEDSHPEESLLAYVSECAVVEWIRIAMQRVKRQAAPAWAPPPAPPLPAPQQQALAPSPVKTGGADAPLQKPEGLLQQVMVQRAALRKVSLPAEEGGPSPSKEVDAKVLEIKEKERGEKMEQLVQLACDEGLLIKAGSYTPSILLGEGRFSSVYKAVNEAGVSVAVKEFRYLRSPPPLGVITSMTQEIKMLIYLRERKCRHTVPIIGVMLEPKASIIFYLMEGDLHKVMTDAPLWSAITMQQKIMLLQQIAEGLESIHDAGVVHRDIKSHNIMMIREEQQKEEEDTRGWNAKIGDFGTATELVAGGMDAPAHQVLREEVGTSGWSAPEVFGGDGYGMPCDIFSFGVLCWETLDDVRDNPLSGLDPDKCKSELEKGVRPVMHQSKQVAPAALVELVHECWATEPLSRPSARQVVVRLKEMSGKRGYAQGEE